jgi:TetR/AcrR family transcriptional repressor of bet genes
LTNQSKIILVLPEGEPPEDILHPRNRMPKLGMEPLRRRALMDATLKTIGDNGSLSVTMQEIARNAGVSAALAHHYFGSKDQLLLASIRSLLAQLKADTVAALQEATGPRQRISAIISVSFRADQFAPEIVAAWLAFYTEAQRSDDTRRLLVIYARRLQSNLLSALKPLCTDADAARIAEGTAAMIDGLYIRKGLKSADLSIGSAIHLVEDYVTTSLSVVARKAA